MTGPSKASASKTNLAPEGLANAYGEGARQPRSAREFTTAPIVPETFLHLVLPVKLVLPLTLPAVIPAKGCEAGRSEELLAAAASERTSRAAKAHVRTMPDLAGPSARLKTSKKAGSRSRRYTFHGSFLLP